MRRKFNLFLCLLMALIVCFAAVGCTRKPTNPSGSGATSGATSGITSGSTSGTASGTTSGETSGSESGTTSGSTSGTTSGSTSGTTSGSTSGTTSGSTSGTTSGSTSGTTSGSTSGTTSGSTSGTASGTTSGTDESEAARVLGSIASTYLTSGYSLIYQNNFGGYSEGYKFDVNASGSPYASINASANYVSASSDADIAIDGKSANLYDQSSSETTKFFIPYAGAADGKYFVALDIRTFTSASKWTLVNYVGTKVCVRADSNKKIAYSTNFDESDSNSATLTASDISLGADVYRVEAVFDYAANKVTIAINGTIIADAVTFDGTALSSISFITSTSGLRSISVDNVKIYAQEGLAPGHVHSLSKVAAQAASCTTNGNVAYWYCDDCGRYYSDSAGLSPISQAATVIVGSHSLTHTAAKAANCTTDGNIEYWYCSKCNKYYSDALCTAEITLSQTVLTKLGHSLTHTAAKAATCTEDGNIEYWRCSRCNNYYSDAAATAQITLVQTITQELGHNYVFQSTVAPNSATQTDGYDIYKCSRCDSTEQRNFVDWKSGEPINVNEDLLTYGAISEGAYITWTDTNVSLAKAYYKLTTATTFTEIDSQLLRSTTTGNARVDYVGLAAGKYDFKVEVGDSDAEINLENIKVTAYDRSGYGFFGATAGVGAYNNDGTLKTGAQVIYVTDANKNTVTLGSYTGIGNILKNASKYSTPVCVRMIGRVSCATWDYQKVKDGGVGYAYYKSSYSTADNTKTRDAALGITFIEGLRDAVTGSSGDWDSVFNQASLSGGNNWTIEGIGDNAEIFQWGITIKSSSVEVRNLTFTDYPEDACAVEGADYKYFWIHNNVFNQGKNYWDLTNEQDKHEGDGSTDFKYASNVTYSYNVYNNCHKTGLIGGSDSNMQSNITFHHNFFNACASRMPLGRQANMHYYNNYSLDISNYCMSLRANAYALSEANYYENCNSTLTVGSGGTPACKSYNDVFDNCTSNDATVVTSRTATVENTCTYGTTFDTDATKFYYDSVNNKTDVEHLTTAAQAKLDVLACAGVCKANAHD